MGAAPPAHRPDGEKPGAGASERTGYGSEGHESDEESLPSLLQAAEVWAAACRPQSEAGSAEGSCFVTARETAKPWAGPAAQDRYLPLRNTGVRVQEQVGVQVISGGGG